MVGATKSHYVYAIDAYISNYDIVLVDINECSSSPCQNGAVCTDAFNSYTCACAAGYTGTHCQIGESVGLPNTNTQKKHEMQCVVDMV